MKTLFVENVLMKRCLCLFSLMLSPAQYTQSQQSSSEGLAARAEVFVLDVYHMGNPGRDIYEITIGALIQSMEQYSRPSS